jgi:CBS domain-containing protein
MCTSLGGFHYAGAARGAARIMKETAPKLDLQTLRAIPAGIWALGFVSLLMDISSEMIHGLLPVYLVTVLGASTLTVGAIEGIAEATASADYVHSHGLAVKEVMTPDPITITENTKLDEVVRLMENRKAKRFPVLRDGKVIGIVTRANLMRALLSIHRTAPQSSDNDAAIRERILADVGRQDWSSGAAVDVVVHGGMVDLWGSVSDRTQRDALKVLAENVPGVVRVEDHLTLKDQFIGDQPFIVA